VASGAVIAAAADGHCVHVDAAGLAPSTAYWYRFRTATATSPAGRARTAPAADALPERLVVAAMSCQNYQHGFYAAHRDVAADPPDLVVFLGDYIYEGGVSSDEPRQHEGPAPSDLDGYRRRYARYKSDPDLQAAHAAAPWVVTWDDHEVENNYAGLVGVGDDGPDDRFAARRAAAYRAWWEHQPVRLPPPSGPDLPIYRSLRWGHLAHLVVADGRQYRSDQACGDGYGGGCPELGDPDRTMLGADQEAWLATELADARRHGTQWALLANQTALTDMRVRFGADEVILYDQWDGYPAARRRVLEAVQRAGSPDLVTLTGDLHTSIVGTVALDGKPLASEFVTPSVSSRFAGERGPTFELGMRFVPAVQLAETSHRGYLRCEITPTEVRATYRWVDDATVADSPVRPASSWLVHPGRPGPVKG
jgi:alkaline phosphatase D